MRTSSATIASLVLCLALGGCGSSSVTVMRFGVDVVRSPEKQTELFAALKRSVLARCDAFTIPSPVVEVTATGSEHILSVRAAQSDGVATLSASLTAKSSLVLMEGVNNPRPDDVRVEKLGAFRPIGIDDSEIAWVESSRDPNGKGAIRITFTPAGQKIFSEKMRSSIGGTLGIFLRGVPISILKVQGTEVSDALTIQNIPTPALADTFRDDVLVSFFLRLRPLP